jgi:hypothetical protein
VYVPNLLDDFIEIKVNDQISGQVPVSSEKGAQRTYDVAVLACILVYPGKKHLVFIRELAF